MPNAVSTHSLRKNNAPQPQRFLILPNTVLSAVDWPGNPSFEEDGREIRRAFQEARRRRNQLTATSITALAVDPTRNFVANRNIKRAVRLALHGEG